MKNLFRISIPMLLLSFSLSFGGIVYQFFNYPGNVNGGVFGVGIGLGLSLKYFE